MASSYSFFFVFLTIDFDYILYIRLENESSLDYPERLWFHMSKNNWDLKVTWHDNQFFGEEEEKEEFNYFSPTYKKSLDKSFDAVLEEIEMTRMQLYEVDKRTNRKSRRKINGKEREFYYSMKSVEERKKISKKWMKTGFLDTLMEVLTLVVPIVKLIAIRVAELINIFLRSRSAKEVLPASFISKLVKVHDIALCV